MTDTSDEQTTDQTDLPDLDQVDETIKEAHRAEDALHDEAPFQLPVDEGHENGFAG